MYLKVRLALMNFLEYAVWGAYLTSMGRYLGNIGLGSDIGWFYSMQGIVSIFMPALMGIIADRWVQAQRLLGLCHLIAGLFMILLHCMVFHLVLIPISPFFLYCIPFLLLFTCQPWH